MTDIREALNGAFDKSTPAETPPPPTESGPSIEDLAPDPGPIVSAPTPPPTVPTPPRDASTGRFAKPAGTPPATAPATPTTPPVAPPAPVGAAPAAPPAEAKPPPPTVKAPQSWRPEVREKWAALPPEVQAEVSRREREVATTLQESAEARKSWTAFRETVAPYEALIRAEGSDPLKAVGNLLQTAAALRTAPPQHKAALVANLVRTFGVPVQALDAALAGEAPPQGAAQPQQAALNPDALLQQAEQRFMQRLAAQQQQRTMAQAQQETEAFISSGEAEFIDDVRDIMANLLDSAGRSRIPLSLKDAYARACLLHPEVSKVLEQRRQAQAATATQATTQRAQAAASSVVSRPAAPPAASQPDDIRSLLEAGWSRASGR